MQVRGIPGDLEPSLYVREEEDENNHCSQKAKLFTNDGEDKIGVWFWKKEHLLAALPER